MKFNGKVSKMGTRKIISIPQALDAMIEEYIGKDVQVTVELKKRK